ncbi:MAG: B12-binding domain-containing radical SAM protein [Desulfococcus sp. 4484_241]|nr:MAG: B12-binding domain-containing radical SAM protein [Desulfococcus sp. 4484_241]
MSNNPTILCVNPWIHDFAAYDFWARPLGLLEIAAILRSCGCRVFYIDCTDRFHPLAPVQRPDARHGRGPYIKTPIPKPAGLEDIPRTYSRYGIPEQWFLHDLLSVPRPDVVLVTSIMTYWYPGVAETIKTIKQALPGVPVVLGGVYASLCPDHARMHSGADIVAAGDAKVNLPGIIEQCTGARLDPGFDISDPDFFPVPALDLQRIIPFVPLLTTRGCPFSCTYCASHILHPGPMVRRSPESVVDEIARWHEKYKVRDFVFYDDALLVDAENHFEPIARSIIKKGWNIRFHTPNAIHVREVNETTARLMRDAGFETVRLGLETDLFGNDRTLDSKVKLHEFERAVASLKLAGFTRKMTGAYMLVGLPNQELEEIKQGFAFVAERGITPIPAYYTPIPGTAMWPDAVACSRYDIESDPVYTNNALLPCMDIPFSWDIITRIKKWANSEED